MQAINTRGTFVVSRACIPHLRRSDNPHILTLSPPISLEPRWLGNTFLGEDVLAQEGVTDLDAYAYLPGAVPQVDLFVDHI
jgi:hypothetical protein